MFLEGQLLMEQPRFCIEHRSGRADQQVDKPVELHLSNP